LNVIHRCDKNSPLLPLGELLFTAFIPRGGRRRRMIQVRSRFQNYQSQPWTKANLQKCTDLSRRSTTSKAAKQLFAIQIKKISGWNALCLTVSSKDGWSPLSRATTNVRSFLYHPLGNRPPLNLQNSWTIYNVSRP